MNYNQITVEEMIDKFRSRLGNNEQFKKIENSKIYPYFVEFLSKCCNVTNFYTQRIADEASISNAKIKSNVIKHCQNLGYEPRRPIPAQAELIIRLKGPFPDEINQPGTEIFFPQAITDLSYNDRKYILDSSYSYVLTQEDIDYCHEPEWEKNLINAVPHTNSIYMPLQGASFINTDLLTPIKCFQGEVKTYTITGASVLANLGKAGQTYNIPDKSFSNWYGTRDPYAYNGERNFIQKNSWCKVGIGTDEADALDDDSLFTIETQAIALNKKYRNLNPALVNALDNEVEELTSNLKRLDTKYRENLQKDIIAKQLKICTITSNPDETVKVSFGYNNVVCNGLMTDTDNIYIKYLSTDGKAANQEEIIGSQMVHANNILASINGNVIDITGNVEFILNSDIYGGDDFESIDSMKINGPAYYTSRNKLIQPGDFKNYFSNLTSPMYVNTAYVIGQQEIEQTEFTDNKFPWAQNIILYSLLGRLYIKNAGDYVPRNILTSDEIISEPYSIYGNEYKNHICDYIKFLISPIGYRLQQYSASPKDQWIKNVQLIRTNCKDNLPFNTTLLSIPPFIHYFDLVGKVVIKPTANLQEYNTRLKNKIYKYLNTLSKKDNKVYKSVLTKIYANDPDTLSVDLDIKLSSTIAASENKYSWTNYTLIENELDKTADSYINENNDNSFNLIHLPEVDDSGKKITELLINKSRITLLLNYYNETTNIIDSEEYDLNCKGIISDYKGKSYLHLALPIQLTLSPNSYIKSVKISVKTEADFVSTSNFSELNTASYKLTPDKYQEIVELLNKWLKGLKKTCGADRAIDLPYIINLSPTMTDKTDDDDAFTIRKEDIERCGNILTNKEKTLSEESFWTYFAPLIIETFYNNDPENPKLTTDTLMDDEYWDGASSLLYDLYALLKPGISDSVLDDNNNIVNYSIGIESSVLINKVNVVQQ